ncbi:hypothetical protein L596_017330 [Steinernema carpocapsae]|uniref:Uncharacterized protein n=1 Tax=Steinernema carpocapsae TaxID=34508 RepID=A0A4U5N1J0_STECR|nr:hypothetical protein L596_017330 [Steinernema carpocapsae]
MNVHGRSRSHCTLLQTKTAKRRIWWMGYARGEFVGYRLHDDSNYCGVSDLFKTAIVCVFSSCVDARTPADNTHIRFHKPINRKTETAISSLYYVWIRSSIPCHPCCTSHVA